MGQKRMVRRRCPVCTPKLLAEAKAEEEAKELSRRREPYERHLPFRDPQYHGVTPDTFQDRPGFEAVLRHTRRFADQLPEPEPQGLLIYGTRGNGKTALSVALARVGYDKGMLVGWMNGGSSLRDIGSWESDEREQYIKLMSRADLLIIDDLGADYITPQRAGWLFTILDSIYRRRRALVVTSNYVPDDLAATLTPRQQGDEVQRQDGDRIMSRLAEMCDFIPNKASDYRMEIAKRRRERGTQTE